MRRVDLNADVGESFGAYTIGDDLAVLDVVTSASVACGFHAGDPTVMTKTVTAAAARGVVVGAHVGYRDLQGFGRRPLAVAPAELTADVIYQLGALAGIARSAGCQVRFVKPHGALYNAAAADPAVARSVVDAVVAFDRSLPLVTLPGSAVVDIAAALGVATITECFADRAYTSAGSLVPRDLPGAVIHDADVVVARALAMATGEPIETMDGASLRIAAQSMCVHGDTPGAAELARRIRAALTEAGVQLKPFA
ncbi:MAG: 5-oxoprolinase (ATP-hydrolyzing) subunit [Actinomycetota bacterium]|nr:5-oxoprolinase (ATP-hydrolyzing) subunit [Actinomycetota bacterium]